MTQEALGAACGLSAQTIGRIERGTQAPTLAGLDAIAHALGVDAADLMRRPGSRAVDRVMVLLRGRSEADVDLVARVLEVVFAAR